MIHTRRRIAIVQLEGTPTGPGHHTRLLCELSPWLAATSAALTLFAIWERIRK